MAGSSTLPAIPDPRLLGVAHVGEECRIWTLIRGIPHGGRGPAADWFRDPSLSLEERYRSVVGVALTGASDLNHTDTLPESVTVIEALMNPATLMEAHLLVGGDFVLALVGSELDRRRDFSFVLSAVDPPLRRDTYMACLSGRFPKYFAESYSTRLPERILVGLRVGHFRLAWLRDDRWRAYRKADLPGHPLNPAQTLRTLRLDDAPEFAKYLSVARVALGVPSDEDRQPIQIAAGTARSPRESRIRAVSEAVERFAIRAGSTGSYRIASEYDLASHGEAFLPAHTLFCYSAEQIARDPRRRPTASNEPIVWVPANSLSTGRTSWVPASLVFIRPEFAAPSAPTCSSGAAAHETLEQATEHALRELVERDAFLRWWHGDDDSASTSLEILPDIRPFASSMSTQGRAVRQIELPSWGDTHTVLTVLTSENGLIAGLACSEDVTAAARKSFSEVWMLSRRWPARAVDMRFVRSPLDHTHFWANCGPRLLNMVDAKIGRAGCSHSPTPLVGPREFFRVEIQTDAYAQRLRVVRVLSPDCVPLSFGFDNEPLGTLGELGLPAATVARSSPPLVPHILG